MRQGFRGHRLSRDRPHTCERYASFLPPDLIAELGYPLRVCIG
jgi:hypothetical protein